MPVDAEEAPENWKLKTAVVASGLLPLHKEIILKIFLLLL